MRVDSFDFDLPASAIATHPAVPRDVARLLVVEPKSDRFDDRNISDLPQLLKTGDVLVFNDTRVIPAQLEGRRRGARIEVTLHKHAGKGRWYAFARPAKRLREGDVIDFSNDFSAIVAAPRKGPEVLLDFRQPDASLFAELERHGTMPLPPYIRSLRAVNDRDRDDYQTIFARHAGAVAAPTAGLHFTQRLMDRLGDRNIETVTLTLHVGAGTFLPVTADDTEDHAMHSEYGVISASTADRLNEARRRGGRIVAVGTTSLRLLETAATENGRLRSFTGDTDIFITPGYRFRAVDLLLTNFHLPRSTLFMLVCAFSGPDTMRRAYAHAIAEGYRFYSYGDACLLHRASDAA